MKHAVQILDLPAEAYRDGAMDWTAVALPPVRWFVRGPRGGLYMATGAVEMRVDEDGSAAFIRNRVRIEARSEGVRYVRPGTRLHAEALEALEALP